LVATNADNGSEPTYGKEHTFTAKTKKTGKSNAKTNLGLTQPEPTLVGDTLVLSGILTGTGNANREVVLQASPYPYRATFADVGAPAQTGIDGGYSFRVPDLRMSTHYRVETVGAPVLVSRTVTALAEVRVALKVRTTASKVGLVRLYGTVSPAEVGARVYFQLEKAAKQKAPTGKPEKSGKSEKSEVEKPPSFTTKFSAIVKRATKTISRFSLVATIQDAGRYRAFVSLAPGPLASGYSQTIMLHAAPTKAKKKK